MWQVSIVDGQEPSIIPGGGIAPGLSNSHIQ